MKQRDAKGRFVSSSNGPKAEQIRVYGKTTPKAAPEAKQTKAAPRPKAAPAPALAPGFIATPKAKQTKAKPEEAPKTKFIDLPPELRTKIFRSVYKLERNALANQYHEWAKDINLRRNGHVMTLDEAKLEVNNFIRDAADMKTAKKDVEAATWSDLNPLYNRGRQNPDWQKEHENRRESAGFEKLSYAEDPDQIPGYGHVTFSIPKQERHDSGLDEFS